MMILATYQLLEIHNNMGNRRIVGLHFFLSYVAWIEVCKDK